MFANSPPNVGKNWPFVLDFNSAEDNEDRLSLKSLDYIARIIKCTIISNG